MKDAFDMSSGAIIYITKFHKDWLRHSKAYGAHTDKMEIA
jgi:hypothetical protein